MEKVRLLRITTVPISLTTLLKGQLSFLQQHNFEVLTVSSPGPETSLLKAEGLKHAVIVMTRQITPLRDLWALWKLVGLIRKFKPTIVHTHTPKAGLLGMMAAWLCGVPVRMHTVAGLPWMESKGSMRTLLKWTEKITYRCATRVYPNSHSLLKFLLNELKLNSSKLKVIGSGSSNGVDEQHFNRALVSQEKVKEISGRFSIGVNDIVFCFVGRIVRDKGIKELVESFTQLDVIPKTWLFLVGQKEGDLDPLPEKTLRLIADNPNIIETGFQADVRPWLAISHVFVFPSYREGFPNVVMQAACMELPCIVSDINGCNEIIQHGQSGLIVPPKNVSVLKEAMLDIISRPDLGKAMGKQGREFVAANFSQQVMWDELLKEYRSYSESFTAKMQSRKGS
jgi:glycosyltransferase involved in cell wall biosynthesis